MHNDRELDLVICELAEILRERRRQQAEWEEQMLAAELRRHARFTRRLERIAGALTGLDYQTPPQ